MWTARRKTPMEFNDRQLMVYNVEKEEIKTLNFKRIEKLMASLKKEGAKFRSSLVITFGGYDDVPEEIYEIPEIRKWSAKFVKRNPEVFYFLNRELEGDQIILTTLCDLTSLHVGEATKSPDEYAREGIDPTKLPQKLVELILPDGLREDISKAVREYGEHIGDQVGAETSLAIFKIFDK
jgi:hypothetical protein